MSRAGAGAAEEPRSRSQGARRGQRRAVSRLVTRAGRGWPSGLWQVQDFKEPRAGAAGAGRGPPGSLCGGAGAEAKPPCRALLAQDREGTESAEEPPRAREPGTSRAARRSHSDDREGRWRDRAALPLGGDFMGCTVCRGVQRGGRGVRDSQSTSSSSRTLRLSLLISSLTRGQAGWAPSDPADDPAGGSCARPLPFASAPPPPQSLDNFPGPLPTPPMEKQWFLKKPRPGDRSPGVPEAIPRRP